MTANRENSTFLSRKELKELTGCVRRDAQTRALNSMGLHHRVRPDGEVIVLREHVQKELGGAINNAVIVKKVEPNWEALNG